MKILDDMIEKALEKSPLLKKTVGVVSATATELANMGHAVLLISKTLEAHRTAIQDLYEGQRIILQAISGASKGPDMKMPVADDKNKTSGKPN